MLHTANTTALTRVLDLFDDDLFPIHLGPQLTCNETDAFADLLRATGRSWSAMTLVAHHAVADEEGDAHCAPAT